MTIMAAVGLGASSGRVIQGVLTRGRIELNEVARFPNAAVDVPTEHCERLHWDVLRLWSEVLDGLRAARPVGAIGIDTWAVDYALVDGAGVLTGNPSAYRCERTRGAAERFFERRCFMVPRSSLNRFIHTLGPCLERVNAEPKREKPGPSIGWDRARWSG